MTPNKKETLIGIFRMYWHDTMLSLQTLSEDSLTQLDEFYQLIAPNVEGEKTWADHLHTF